MNFSIIFKNMQVLPVYMMNFTMVFLIFLIFSFVGWVSEVLYVGIFFEHRFVNRGFLHGPLCPIYGFGGCRISFQLDFGKAFSHPLVGLFAL